MKLKWFWLLIGFLSSGIGVWAQEVPQQQAALLQVNVGTGSDVLAPGIQLILLVTILSLAPSILVLLSSFTRIVIVFHFLRQALGLQSAPSNSMLAGMALIMTLFIMGPALRQIKSDAYDPFRKGEVTFEEALDRAAEPLKIFMLKHTRDKDLALFLHLSQAEKPASRMDVSLEILVPAFVISELKTAFQIGFLIFIPFLIIDLVVSSILLGMGMMMLPPALISLPFKILLFVMVDGWHLVVRSLMESFI